MTRRYVSIWLPHWVADRWRRQNDRHRDAAAPLGLTARGVGGLRLTAVDAVAAKQGLRPGMTLADARALVPELAAAEADPAADATALAQLADWCRRWTPLAAIDGADGLVLDITGCDHLFGGEAKLLAGIAARLAGAGLTARLALADTPAAAWAWARHRPSRQTPVLPAGADHALLAALPAAALRLADDLVADLARLGLRSIADLRRLPRAPLVRRFGQDIGRRLDQLFGLAPEPIGPRSPPIAWSARLTFAEPIGRRADFEAATARLLDALCGRLERGGRGARRLELTLYRVDAACQRLAAGTSRPSHDGRHLLRLFRERFDRIDPGFGVELMVLDAIATEPLAPRQAGFADEQGADAAELVDRLRARAGPHAVLGLTHHDTHVPERATLFRPFTLDAADGSWAGDPARPVMLLAAPEPVAVTSTAAGTPSLFFRWRGRAYRIGRFDGPERIGSEWWRDGDQPSRDYYAVEADDGRRFWLFRQADRWYLHGLFA